MMKLLFVCEQGRHYQNIVKELRKNNQVDFLFISSQWKKEEGDYHIPKLFGRHKGYKFLAFILVHYLLLTKKYDFCVTDYRSVFMPSFVALIKCYTNIIKTKFIHDLRTIPVEHDEDRSKIVEKRFLKQLHIANRLYQGISVITDEMIKHLEKKYLHIKKPIGIWESGVDINLFKPIPKNSILKMKLGFEENDFVCFYHGTLTDKRGVIELVESFKYLKLQKMRAKLLILGGKGNFSQVRNRENNVVVNSTVKRIQNVINSFDLVNTVKIHDWVEYIEVPEFISIADFCVVPLYDIEWWRVSSPLKLMEYIACGKNILLTNMVAHSNVVGGSSDYFFLPEVTAESIAEKISEAYQCFERNPIQFYERGLKERERLVCDISWEKRAEKLKEFLDKFRL